MTRKYRIKNKTECDNEIQDENKTECDKEIQDENNQAIENKIKGQETEMKVDVTETKEDETVNKEQVSVIANESEEMIVLLISEWNIESDSNITTQVTDENKVVV